MKKSILIIIMVFVPLLSMAQAAGGTISRPAVPSKQKVIKRSGKSSKTKTVVPNKDISTRERKSGTVLTHSESHSATIMQKSQTPVTKKEIPPIIQNLIGNMVFVEGGIHTMPASNDTTNSIDNLSRKVSLSSFFIGKFEVTQEEWIAIMITNPSVYLHLGNKIPVHNVSWEDCQEFVKRLNSLTGMHFRLPTAAEWEYAAGGGKNTRNYKFSGGNNLSNVAWISMNSNHKIHTVGEKTPNELGLYDMSGNVKEWCQEKIDNKQIESLRWTPGNSCIVRGGSFLSGADECIITNRKYVPSQTHDVALGFRLVLEK